MKAARVSPVTALLIGGAVLLGGVPRTLARSPTTAEQESLDWVLARLAEDRDHEKSQAGSQDFVTSFKNGQGALSEWDQLVKTILDPTAGPGKAAERERCVTAVLERFKLEDDRNTLGKDVIFKERKKVCDATLDLMLRPDNGSRIMVYRMQASLLPAERVQWKPGDSLTSRKRAHADLKKWLEAK